MKKLLILVSFVFFAFSVAAQTAFQAGANKVSFRSGTHTLVGHLYLPAGFSPTQKLAVVVVDGPQSSVKEQVSGNYAQRLAEAGLVALAFDHQGYGESEGFPRQDKSPAKKVEDIHQAVTYLLSLPFVDEAKIGALGICSGGGYSAKAVSEDPRIAAFVGIAGFYHDPKVFEQWLGQEGYQQLLDRAIASRNKYEQTGQVDYMVNVSDKGGDLAMPGQEAFDYYGTPRSYSPGWVIRSTTMSFTEFLQFNAIDAARLIRVPALIIHSDKALVPQQGARQFYASLPGEKELYWMNTASHIAFYDQAGIVQEAGGKAARWLLENLGANNSSSAN